MTPPAERYPDLVTERDDPALVRLVGALDQALQALPAPPHLALATRRHLAERLAATAAPVPVEHPAPGALTRRDALRAGMAAAGAAWLLALGQTSPASAEALARLAQGGPMSASRLVALLRSERARWEALLGRVGPARMDLAGVDGTWSVKQIVAHLTWYDGVIVEGAQQILRAGRFVREGLRALSMDERNAILAARSRARPAHEVLAESERVFGQLLAVVGACPDELLNDPRHLGLPDDVVPWMLVANNSYMHYQEHARAILGWLATDPVAAGGAPPAPDA